MERDVNQNIKRSAMEHELEGEKDGSENQREGKR